MMTQDNKGNVWVAQDGADTLMKIDTVTNETKQVEVPWPQEVDLKITGPAIGTAPDGSVWCSLLGGDGALVRVDPDTEQRTLYLLPEAPWIKHTRFIHMVWYVKSGTRCPPVFTVCADPSTLIEAPPPPKPRSVANCTRHYYLY